MRAGRKAVKSLKGGGVFGAGGKDNRGPRDAPRGRKKSQTQMRSDIDSRHSSSFASLSRAYLRRRGGIARLPRPRDSPPPPPARRSTKCVAARVVPVGGICRGARPDRIGRAGGGGLLPSEGQRRVRRWGDFGGEGSGGREEQTDVEARVCSCRGSGSDMSVGAE
jgi:hypothetical protein